MPAPSAQPRANGQPPDPAANGQPPDPARAVARAVGAAGGDGPAVPSFEDVRASVLGLADRFRPHAALTLTARWVLEITGHGAYTVEVDRGTCHVTPGAHPDANATLTTDPATSQALLTGRLDGLAAFTQGRMRVTGDLNLAMRLETLMLPGPKATRFLRTSRTDACGVDLEAVIAGRGAPVVLLHGLGASKVSFAPLMDGLADYYEVHAVDLPGFGKSDKPLPGGGRYSPRWLAGVVHDYLRVNGLSRVWLVGNSMGGRVAVELALRHPDRVVGLVGLGSAVAFDRWQRFGPVLRRLSGHWLGVAPFPVPTARVESSIGGLFHDRGCIPDHQLRAAAAEFQRCARDPRFRLATLACARYLAAEPATGRRSFWRRLAQLEVPSYWIWGESDRVSPSRYARRVAQHLPEARVEVWPRIGHAPQFEDPERTSTRIREFLNAVEDGR